ncbi:Ig-like domain-containing protein [Pelistega sp. NLN82]|uniref:Ig-like domain-containing protein n=1 Tax=Pelistega ratti TaxID=2652177 RepID=A0A6L9Y4G3_9BURK|nr:Ig-like domain-containing protein [Pelistega ratti]NEN75233.1 Ig-like domain-containing protein [Pelistega ratti]
MTIANAKVTNYVNTVVDPASIIKVTLPIDSKIFPGTVITLHSYYSGNGNRLGNEGEPIRYVIKPSDIGKTLTFGVPAPIAGEKVVFTYDATNALTGLSIKNEYIDTIARLDVTKQLTSIIIGNGDDQLTADEVDADGKVAITVTLPKGVVSSDQLVLETNQGEGISMPLSSEVIAQSQVEIKVDAPEGGENNELLVSAYIVDRHGNGSAVTEHVYLLDMREPQATIELNNITADNVINAEESQGYIRIKGKVKGDFQEGDQVRIFLDDNTYYTRAVDADGNFFATIPASQLVNDADKTIKAVLTTYKNNKAFTFEAEKAYEVDITAPNANTTKLTLNNITADNVINAEEAQGNVVISGKVIGEFNAGDHVRIFLDENTFYTRYVDETGYFQATVPASQLVNDADKTVYAVLTTTDAAGNTGTIRGEKQYAVDTVAPNADSTRITLDNITADNVINAQEAQGSVTVSGQVRGEFNVGDQVRIFLDENTYYTRYVDENGRFAAEVSADYLVNDADKTVYAVLTTTDAAGNTGTIRGEKQYAVDTVAPNADSTRITLDNITADNVITTKEVQGTVTISGQVRGEFNAGDQVRIHLDENTFYTRYVDENGRFSVEVSAQSLIKDADKTVYAVLTTTDAAGNTGTIRADKQYGVELKPAGETIELRALNGDLTLYYGVSKSGSKNGSVDVSFTVPKGADAYTTTDGDDRVFIGYHANGQEFRKGQAGSISNWMDNNTQYGLKTDGNKSISTLDTGAGDDYVRIRGDENQQTRIYLGEGNDQVDIRLKVTSAVSTAGASSNKNQAVSAIFGESGDDIINIGGSIHNSIISGGSGSDNINIGFGALGGGSLVGSTIIDLGSGKPMPAVYLHTYQDGTGRSLGNDHNTDSVFDVNHLRIAVNVDPGAKIYGGKGKDIVEIGGRFNGKMELGSGDDSVTYVQGTGKINGGSGNDTVKITGKNAILQLKDFIEVETIDISGSGSNTLRVTSDAARADRTTVFVKGGFDDKVDFGNVSPNRANFKEGNKGSWYKVGSTVKDGVHYDGYEFNYQDDTLVYVQANIQVV